MRNAIEKEQSKIIQNDPAAKYFMGSEIFPITGK
jgi:hypothetical protein